MAIPKKDSRLITVDGTVFRCLFLVKGSQPTLHRRFKALPWRDAILNDRTDETAHGRREGGSPRSVDTGCHTASSTLSVLCCS
ncbi:hypothetical protein [Nonomuraea harbinensis]|uniref:Transposase n=1 Tax=Nonomuraea harbinensis TaxID=1286938 RepID=A0ABW1CB34_9ACTN|nr:hypothetical protein [Nonomuraea harbinensis]